jgi:hypothetical protein
VVVFILEPAMPVLLESVGRTSSLRAQPVLARLGICGLKQVPQLVVLGGQSVLLLDQVIQIVGGRSLWMVVKPLLTLADMCQSLLVEVPQDLLAVLLWNQRMLEHLELAALSYLALEQQVQAVQVT